jgi:glycine amidinotransferase
MRPHSQFESEAIRRPPVSSFNEWDPLEEVIVGRIEGAAFPAWRTINEHTVPDGDWDRIEAAVGAVGAPYPATLVAEAQRCLDGFIHRLESEGVTVRRPDVTDHARPFATPEWSVSTGFCTANPRDPFVVIGDEILETPMADRSRYFEAWAYRRLFTEYLKAGARWTSAPKPRLLDDLFTPGYRTPSKSEPLAYQLTEVEPVFDAADMVRCGRDIFIQRSQVTNGLGILWLQRHLGERFRVHEIVTRNPEAIHIDTTFMPLCPGKVLVSPEYLDLERLPECFRTWEVRACPEPVPTIHDPLGIISRWGAVNVLMVDERRVVVEARQEPLIRMLAAWGFEPIPCPFEAYFPFMGSFHCATLDVRRRGELQSYF